MSYAIFCTVCGGATGSRSAYLKEDSLGAIHFSYLRRGGGGLAARLTKAMNGPHARAYFYYRAVTGSASERNRQ